MSLLWRCKITDSSGNVAYSRRTVCKRSTTRWRNVYDLDGLRVKRTNGETNYLYTYHNGKLTHMKVDGRHYYFTYNPSGTPIAVTLNGKNYYYVTNLQGDVTHILDDTGAVVTAYTYNAWGKVISVTGAYASTLGRYNPLRYRGYVYDNETGLYYLQSRYYNPETGRFINADAFVATGQGILGNNMFVYCGNNPVCNIDVCGTLYERSAGGGGGGGGAPAAGAAIDFSWVDSVGSGDGIVVSVVAIAFPLSTFTEIDNLRTEQIERRRNSVIAYQNSKEAFSEQLTTSLAKAVVPQTEYYHIHHIVAQRAAKAEPARYILGLLGISVNDVINLVPVRASVHQRLHNNWYYITVNTMVMGAYVSAGTDKRQQYKNVTNVLLYLRVFITSF